MIAVDTICGAITERRLLGFTYKGARRTAEPYILGYDDRDRLTLSAFQTAGGTGMGFRTFPIDGLSALAMIELGFSAMRPEYNPRDRFFARVVCQV